MKKILFFALLLPILASAQDLVPYKKAVPKISEKGVITFPDGKTKSITGWYDKNTTVIFLVRHAEKDTAGGNMADLNPVGRGRAEALVKMLKMVKIDKIYSTDRPRTKNTAVPLSKLKRKNVEIYDAAKQNTTLEEILTVRKGKKIFMVGHSNTVPQILNALTGKKEFTDIPDNVYTRFYVVSVKKMGDAVVQMIEY